MSLPYRTRLRLDHGAAAGLLLLATVAGGLILLSPQARGARTALERCGTTAEFQALASPLPRTTRRLADGSPLTIVTLGSSSTEGVGASRSDLSYPSRLSILLKDRFPTIDIRVINRGIGGETASEMAARIPDAVLAEKPDLVIWQVGTNAVLRDKDPTSEIEAVQTGISRIRATGSDVMLMDLQYAPAVLLHIKYRKMLRLLSATAHGENIPLLSRFALMRRWVEDGRLPLPMMLAADRLHMTDASYDCLARQVATKIAAAAASR